MHSSGVEKLAGDQMKVWLEKVNNNRFKSAIFGAIATGMVLSFCKGMDFSYQVSLIHNASFL